MVEREPSVFLRDKPFFQVGMDWHCLGCRRVGTRWFVLPRASVTFGPGSGVRVDVGLEEELAEVDHALSGCDGRVVREGFAMVREVAKEELKSPVWLEVCHDGSTL
jgi:hypothetical protein